MDAFTTLNTGLAAVAKAVNFVKDNVTGYYGTASLADMNKLTRVEPLAVVSRDLINMDQSKDILTITTSLFAAYYMQAVETLTKIKDLEVIRTLDSLNPDRDHTGFLLEMKAREREQKSKSGAVTESYQSFSLEAMKHRLPTHARPTLEAEGGSSKDLEVINNLAVGKLINVGFDGKDGKTISLTMQIRLAVTPVTNDSIVRILTWNVEDLTPMERFHSARSGRIGFIRDFILAEDLITDYKRAAIQDGSNTLSEITRRANNSKKYGLLTRNPSLATASNIFVLSDTAARDVETKLGGKLDNVTARGRLFENTSAMIVVVVHREWQQVTFYTRHVARGTTLTFREIAAKNKGSGPDVMEIFKTLMAGQPPAF